MHHQLTVTWNQVKETMQDLLSGEEYVDYKSNKVPTHPGKPGKMRVHLENLEISWNFEKFNKYHGKMTWNLEKLGGY